jgi:hypothetical protein
MDEEPSDSQLAAFLRSHRELILQRWLDAVVDRPESRGLSREALIAPARRDRGDG